MNKKLYVGNLPYDTDEDAIRELFSPYGDVASVDMINDRDTGRFRGFAFVAMEAEAADEAAKALNGYSMGGRPLKVNEAKPKEPRPGGNGGGGYSSGGSRGSSGNRNSYSSNRGGGSSNRW